ncbi:hypothetical protein P8452_49455 [Trifolium repens]|nr:hypothetical protein P8452_49455 [Trifolium repens]
MMIKEADANYKRQSGRFAAAIGKLERDYSEMVPQWKDALFQVSNLAGWRYGTEYEYEIIQKIVESTIKSLPRYDIMECKKVKNQLVWPIFYKIEQSDVSNQTKSYGKAMTAHEDRFGKDSENVQKWRSALSEVALLERDHIKENEYEYEFIKKIVEKAIEAENHM